jgi:hypothetical protein
VTGVTSLSSEPTGASKPPPSSPSSSGPSESSAAARPEMMRRPRHRFHFQLGSRSQATEAKPEMGDCPHASLPGKPSSVSFKWGVGFGLRLRPVAFHRNACCDSFTRRPKPFRWRTARSPAPYRLTPARVSIGWADLPRKTQRGYRTPIDSKKILQILHPDYL